jgi:hypothetical protein
MRKIDRDAKLKLLVLQGALYRVEVVEAKIALCDSSKSSATTRRLFSFLKFALEHRQLTLIGAVLPRLLGQVRSSRFAGRMLLILGSSLAAWWLLRRQSED